MKRRDFLKAALALPAVAAVPALAAPIEPVYGWVPVSAYEGVVFHDGFIFVSRSHGVIVSSELNAIGRWENWAEASA